MTVIIWNCLTVLSLLSSVYGNHGPETNDKGSLQVFYQVKEIIPQREKLSPLERYARSIDIDVNNAAENAIHEEKYSTIPENLLLKKMESGNSKLFGDAEPYNAKNKHQQAEKGILDRPKQSFAQAKDGSLSSNENFENKGLPGPIFLLIRRRLNEFGLHDAYDIGSRGGYFGEKLRGWDSEDGTSQLPGRGQDEGLRIEWKVVHEESGSVTTGELVSRSDFGSDESEKENIREKRSILMRGGITGKDYWDRREGKKVKIGKEKEENKSFLQRNKASTENTGEWNGQVGSHVGWDVIMGATGGALGGTTGGGIGAGLGGAAGGPAGAAGAAALGGIGSGIGGAIGGGLGSAIGGGIGEMLGGDTAVTIMTGLGGGIGGAIGSGIGGGIGGALGGGAGGAANGLGVMGIPGAIGGGIGGLIGGALGGGAGAAIGGAIGTQFDGGIGGETGNSAKGDVTASLGGRDDSGPSPRMGDGDDEEDADVVEDVALPQAMDCINILVIPVEVMRKKRNAEGRHELSDQVVSLIVGHHKSK